MSPLNGGFARIFGEGENQVLVYISGSLINGMPVLFCAANANEKGYHTISAEMMVANHNLDDPSSVFAQTEAYIAGLTDEDAQKMGEILRADFRAQMSALFAESMGVMN